MLFRKLRTFLILKTIFLSDQLLSFSQETLQKFEERRSYFFEEISVLEWIVGKEVELAAFSEGGGLALSEEEEKHKLDALEKLKSEITEFKTKMIDFEIRHTENVMGKADLMVWA